MPIKQVLAAQTELATAAGTRPELQTAFVVELLSLFVDTGMANSSKGLSTPEVRNLSLPLRVSFLTQSVLQQRAQALLSLIPVLDAFFTSAKLDPRRPVDVIEVALFRSMWYLCCLSGFLSPASRIAEWQRAALVRIAVQTPCLLADAIGRAHV